MGQQVQTLQARSWQARSWKSTNGQRQWLSMLIATMEEISRPEQRNVSCDSLALAGLRAQLMRPASAHVTYGSPYGLRN